MKTQLLYILVSSQADVYLEQAFVSVSSARLRNPGVRIVLLTDSATAGSLAERGVIGESFREMFDEILVQELDPALPPMQRSRILKTGMRKYVKGDFLFIDADTIIAWPLQDIDKVKAPLAACRDLHSPFAQHPHRQAIINMCRKIGFDASAIPEYFNSGVMLVRDVPAVHRFFEAWQQNYEASFAAGIRPDQLSLAKTNAKSQIALLPDAWNCEVQNGVRYLGSAYIWHYMVTNVGSGPQDSLYLLNNPETLLSIREEGGVTAQVKAVIEDPFTGYAPVTQVFAGEDLYLFRTRRYRWLRKHYQPGKKSFREFCLKVWDHLLRRA